jgi:hypothetical protein
MVSPIFSVPERLGETSGAVPEFFGGMPFTR